jgi:two-component system KDP operon response regulator KdpE
MTMRSPKRRILYCEDDPDSRELIRVVFTRSGYDIMCAASGLEALQLAKLEQFDLFLVDNWMPHFTGVELAQHIREFNQTTPILFCSGAAHEADRQAALNAGAQGYHIKPLDIDLLVAEVARLIRESS